MENRTRKQLSRSSFSQSDMQSESELLDDVRSQSSDQMSESLGKGFFSRLSNSFVGKKPIYGTPEYIDGDYDSDDLKHNCHSDPDLYYDEDPLYEYNKCNKLQFLEKRCLDPIYQFDTMSISKPKDF
jgi:hypothetical protein